MAKYWALVAESAHAWLFSSADHGKTFTLEREIQNPNGKKMDRELGADHPGRSSDSFSRRHSLESEVGPHEHAVDLFVGDLAEILREGRTSRSYDRLLVVAEPKFLGKVRQKLDRETEATIYKTFNKELAKMSPAEMSQRITEYLRAD